MQHLPGVSKSRPVAGRGGETPTASLRAGAPPEATEGRGPLLGGGSQPWVHHLQLPQHPDQSTPGNWQKESVQGPRLQDPSGLCWFSGSFSALLIFCSKREAQMDRAGGGESRSRASLCPLPSLGRVARATGSGSVTWVQALPGGPSGSLTTCCPQHSQAGAAAQLARRTRSALGLPAARCVCNSVTLFLELGFSHMRII